MEHLLWWVWGLVILNLAVAIGFIVFGIMSANAGLPIQGITLIILGLALLFHRSPTKPKRINDPVKALYATLEYEHDRKGQERIYAAIDFLRDWDKKNNYR